MWWEHQSCFWRATFLQSLLPTHLPWSLTMETLISSLVFLIGTGAKLAQNQPFNPDLEDLTIRMTGFVLLQLLIMGLLGTRCPPHSLLILILWPGPGVTEYNSNHQILCGVHTFFPASVQWEQSCYNCSVLLDFRAESNCIGSLLAAKWGQKGKVNNLYGSPTKTC